MPEQQWKKNRYNKQLENGQSIIITFKKIGN